MPDRRTPPRTRESLKPEERLRRRADILRCYERGHRCHGRLLTVWIAEREPKAVHPRLGITVTRKVGGAVVRQRVKRRIKETYRRWSERGQLPPYDILVQAKPAAGRAEFSALREDLLRLLARLLVEPRRQAG